MSRLLYLVLSLLALQSCSPKFNTPEARRSTMFYLRDTSEMRGELMAVIQDSIILIRSDTSELDPLKVIRSLHHNDLEFVVFHNEASTLLNGVGAMIGGAMIGGVGGVGLGTLTDRGGHSGGWGGLIGGFFGVSVGAVSGLVIGLVSGMNHVVEIDSRDDLEEMREFARFKDAIELKQYRGY
jgi:hypothetical protein